MTTPSFKRVLFGPRGGQSQAPTPCADCVAFECCRPGAINRPFGCDSWVDLEGRRVDPGADDKAALAEPGERFTFETIGGLVKGHTGDPLDVEVDDRDGLTVRDLARQPDPGDLFAGLGFEEITIKETKR